MVGYHRYRHLLLLCPPISFDHPYLHRTSFELSFSEKVAIRGEGKCILAASQAQGEAFVLEEQSHSVFTYYLLKVLKGEVAEEIDENGYVTVDSLSRSVYHTIMSLPPDKRPKQKPVRKIEASGDIVVAYYPHLSQLQKDDQANLLLPETTKQQLEESITKSFKIKGSINTLNKIRRLNS
jgi:uncharacterized caspase-like protein